MRTDTLFIVSETLAPSLGLALSRLFVFVEEAVYPGDLGNSLGSSSLAKCPVVLWKVCGREGRQPGMGLLRQVLEPLASWV